MLTAVTHWLKIPAMDIYQQLNPRYNKLSCGEDYLENLWDCSTIKSELFLLKLKKMYLKYIKCKLIFLETLTLVERRLVSLRIIQFLLHLQRTWY